MNDCKNPNPSADEMKHEIEHGEHHMDGELCGMGAGSDKDMPLSPEEIAKLVSQNGRA